MASAWSNTWVSSVWQKYRPACSSWSSTSLAPLAAASRMPLMLSRRLWARSAMQLCCTRPTFRCLVALMSSSLLRHHAAGELHGHAVQAAVLVDQGAAGHTHDLAAREAARQRLQGR